MAQKEIKITDRQITHLREEISRIKRQIDLMQKGDTHVRGKHRSEIAIECCLDIDRVLCEL